MTNKATLVKLLMIFAIVITIYAMESEVKYLKLLKQYELLSYKYEQLTSTETGLE